MLSEYAARAYMTSDSKRTELYLCLHGRAVQPLAAAAAATATAATSAGRLCRLERLAANAERFCRPEHLAATAVTSRPEGLAANKFSKQASNKANK